MSTGESGNCNSRRWAAGPALPMESEEVMPPLPVCAMRIGASYDIFLQSRAAAAAARGERSLLLARPTLGTTFPCWAPPPRGRLCTRKEGAPSLTPLQSLQGGGGDRVCLLDVSSPPIGKAAASSDLFVAHLHVGLRGAAAQQRTAIRIARSTCGIATSLPKLRSARFLTSQVCHASQGCHTEICTAHFFASARW